MSQCICKNYKNIVVIKSNCTNLIYNSAAHATPRRRFTTFFRFLRNLALIKQCFRNYALLAMLRISTPTVLIIENLHIAMLYSVLFVRRAAVEQFLDPERVDHPSQTLIRRDSRRVTHHLEVSERWRKKVEFARETVMAERVLREHHFKNSAGKGLQAGIQGEDHPLATGMVENSSFFSIST